MFPNFDDEIAVLEPAVEEERDSLRLHCPEMLSSFLQQCWSWPRPQGRSLDGERVW